MPPARPSSGGSLPRQEPVAQPDSRDRLRAEVASIVVHGGGSSAVVRFADPDFRHRLLGSKQEVPIERNGLALRITRNRESANTDEVRCWGESWGDERLSADDLWRFFSPHGASGQQRRDLQSKTLPQKRPLWTHDEHYGHGDGHRGSGRDRSEGGQQRRRDSNWDSRAPRPVWQ
jgi:hypothetical protein